MELSLGENLINWLALPVKQLRTISPADRIKKTVI